MEYEVFDHEWQRVAVDKAPTTHDQLQDILGYIEKLDYVEAQYDKLRGFLQPMTERQLTQAEQSVEQGRYILQMRLWHIRNNDWQFRNENGEWEDA